MGENTTNQRVQNALNNKLTLMVFACLQAMILGLGSWLWSEFNDLRDEVIERRQVMTAIDKVDVKVDSLNKDVVELKITARSGPDWMRQLLTKHDSDLEDLKESVAELKRR